MGKKRILIVDDNVDFADMMAEILRDKDHFVDVAYDGEEAVKKFQDSIYDITFMDIRLPGMNGVESFCRIKQIKQNAVVIMMTGFSLEHLAEQAREHGVYDVLHKPLDMQRVLELIERIKPSGVVLIADDDQDFVSSIKLVLENRGYRVCIANDGKQALDLILCNGIDVLLLDLRLPTLSGLEVYKKLKQSNRTLPTILVTAFADQEKEAVATLESLSVKLVLRKPFAIEDLIKYIEKLLPEK